MRGETPVRPTAARGRGAPTLRRVSRLPARGGGALPGLAMFTHCARKVRADFALTANNASDVAGICRRLDGLPLALELAARVKVLSPRTLLERLYSSLKVLSSGRRDASARQRIGIQVRCCEVAVFDGRRVYLIYWIGGKVGDLGLFKNILSTFSKHLPARGSFLAPGDGCERSPRP